MTSRFATLIGLLVFTTACGTSTEGTTPDAPTSTVEADAEPSTAVSTTPAPTTTAEPTSALVFDSRITPITALADPRECQIPDITKDGSQVYNTSGFPRPESAVDSLSDLDLLVVPVSVDDSVFDDADLTLVEEMLDHTTRFYEHQSFGKVTINATIAPRDKWVTLPGTAESTGMTQTQFGFDRTSIFRDTVIAASEDLDLLAYDMIAVYTHKDERFYFGQGIVDVDTPDGRLPHGVLMGGQSVALWTVLAHEIGHSWLASEDLYYFPDQSQIMMGGWDLMAQPIAVTIELSPWLRWINEWVTDSQVRCVTQPGETVHHLETISASSDLPKMIVVKLSDHSVLVIDSRRELEFGVDGYDSNGDATIVYVVDTSINHGQGPIRWRGELRAVGESLTTDGVTVTLLDADATNDLVSVSLA